MHAFKPPMSAVSNTKTIFSQSLEHSPFGRFEQGTAAYKLKISTQLGDKICWKVNAYQTTYSIQ